MRYMLPILLAAAACAQAMPQTLYEGKDEVLVLDAWASARRWAVAECTVTQSTDRLADGRPTVRMHIPVDYYAGEKKYPIGWPRAWFSVKQLWETDWTRFERFEFSVYTKSSRAKLPRTPVTLILSCPDRAHQWIRNLTELKLNQWVKFSLPISKMKYVEAVKTVKFSIAESNYKHGDTIDFYIGGFRFVRSTECKLSEMTIKTKAVYEGSATLDVEVEVAGVPKGMSRPAPFTIRQRGKVLRQESLPVRRGRYTLAIEIGELKLKPGTYRLTAFEGDKDREKSGEFRVVNSPWKEK